VTVAAANNPPTAAFTWSCPNLTCTFDGTGSSDSDGSVTSWSWDFGDNSTGSGSQPSHTYATAGPYTVTLTVTDNNNATSAPVAHQVTVTAPVSPISFVGATSSNTTTTKGTVAMPSGVQTGDALLLWVTVNSTTPTVADPVGGTGWTQVVTTPSPVTAGSEVNRLYTKVVQAGDLGQSTSVSLSSSAKLELQLAAYRGTASTGAIASYAYSALGSGSARNTPSVTVSDPRAWVVSFWVDKSTATTGWTPSANATTRQVTLGSGSGYLTSVLADSGGPVPVGGYGPLTASSTSTPPGTPGSACVTWSVVLAPSP
jgi:PKD repeat protein